MIGEGELVFETPYCPYCGAKMEVQDESPGSL